jgi:hypothetical protein
MKTFPFDIQMKFFEFLNDDISSKELEPWIYENLEIELFLSENQYFELISLNFKSNKHLKHELKKIIDEYLDYGEFEKMNLIKILNNIIYHKDNLLKSLLSLYDYYCNGYYFLKELGLNFVLEFEYLFPDTQTSEKEIDIYIEKNYKYIKIEAEKIFFWIESKKIILTGKSDSDIHLLEYIDNRLLETDNN